MFKHKVVEKEWREKWQKNPYIAVDFSKKRKLYALVEFPYPSGEGLHLGHAFTNVILDIFVRKNRMSGLNVLYPMGWDAFGLPTENYAIKTGIQPSTATRINTEKFKEQMKKLALDYDWTREINTTTPNYYKWTQWIFLKLFEKGLAYKAESPVGWCPSCKIVLANEEILSGKCERCGSQAKQKLQKQWMLRITAYADRLAEDLNLVDYPTSAKLAQRNWIGKKEGALIKFKIPSNSKTKVSEIEVFSTHIETLYGVSFIAIAPEHFLAKELSVIDKGIAKYILSSSEKSERYRKESVKGKTGINTNLCAINPLNDEEVPIWISDFVLPYYATGAVMGVPSNDERDEDFAREFNIPIREVVKDGKLLNSGKYTGYDIKIAQELILKDLKGKACKKTIYHLRDWVFSRQHYWGEPIPIVNCSSCGLVPLPENQLPLELPEVQMYQPTETGESPLANIIDWVNSACPKCNRKAKRETDTMPNWAGSSWYFLRYVDPKNEIKLADYKKLTYWMPVDLYLGGAEHTTLHLLYSRFWYKFLFDIHVVPSVEPYIRRLQHGTILAEDGTKMSKSKGNVVNPDEIIDKYGCDAVRIYLAFLGPYDQTMSWKAGGIRGSKRFVEKIWKIYHDKDRFSRKSSKNLSLALNKTIIKVGADIEGFKHNTAISSLMTFVNLWDESKALDNGDSRNFLIVLSPFAPFLAEELWNRFIDSKSSVHKQNWPKVNKVKSSSDNLVIMINGKTRGVIETKSIKKKSQKNITEFVKSDEKIRKYFDKKNIKKVIYIPGKVINFILD